MSGLGQGLPFRVRWKHVGSTPDKLTTLLHRPSRQPWGHHRTSGVTRHVVRLVRCHHENQSGARKVRKRAD
jgi:hypothetical protein